MQCIFSVDVEDWFHILDVPAAPPLSIWDKLPSSVEKNFHKLLDIFSEHNTAVTCFFLGWVAQRYPHLVKEAAARGHEIASHSYAHRLVYRMSPAEFVEDAAKARMILEDLAGKAVEGFRSPGFSVTERVPWFFEKVLEAGYLYDSSVFPARRGHGGMPQAPLEPHLTSEGLFEFPMTVVRPLGRPCCLFGGGYLRFFPLPLIRLAARRVLAEGRAVIFYVHPREIDPAHPRLPMGRVRAFKSYVNLKSTEGKIHWLLEEFEFTTFERFLQDSRRLHALPLVPGTERVAAW